MKKTMLLVTLLMLTIPLTGCLERIVPVQIDDSGGCLILEPGRDSDGTLRILTYDIAAFSDEMLAEFTNQTGYPVEMIRTDDSGGILEQLLQTQQAQQADLAIGLDNTYLQTALNFCLLQPHNASVSGISETALEPYNGPLALPFDRGDVCLNYDETRVDGTNLTVPTSLWNLTEPEWNGLAAFPSPVTSSPGRAFMAATIDYFENDEDDTTDAFDWWKAMAANGAIFTTGWTEAYEIHYSGGYGEWVEGHLGDAAMTVSYCHSPGVEAFYGGNWTKSTSLTLPRSSFHQVEYAGVINGGTELDAAKAFITYLLSEEVNRNMPENNLMQSVLVNATWPETDGYAHHTDLPELNAEISNERIADEMEDWLSAWKDATQ
ncbi:MAG: thiamine ABC transporter substrate-binding protein [Candidatus Thermoplasmatota archaeon]|nr:thiamine ABC transporter substrate-binding protein [Candidatus Thermoplasmatota archaeon]